MILTDLLLLFVYEQPIQLENKPYKLFIRNPHALEFVFIITLKMPIFYGIFSFINESIIVNFANQVLVTSSSFIDLVIKEFQESLTPEISNQCLFTSMLNTIFYWNFKSNYVIQLLNSGPEFENLLLSTINTLINKYKLNTPKYFIFLDGRKSEITVNSINRAFLRKGITIALTIRIESLETYDDSVLISLESSPSQFLRLTIVNNRFRIETPLKMGYFLIKSQQVKADNWYNIVLSFSSNSIQLTVNGQTLFDKYLSLQFENNPQFVAASNIMAIITSLYIFHSITNLNTITNLSCLTPEHMQAMFI